MTSAYTTSLWNNISNFTYGTELQATTNSSCLNGPPSTKSEVIQITTQCIIGVLMFGLGNATDIKLIWKYLKRPKQYVTALILQLVCFPFLGLALTQIFQFTSAQSMGAIITCSCPGGAYSNIVSYWLDGDMNLSIVLTTLSTILALGTMPVWLYTLPLIINVRDECLKIPFEQIGYALLAIIFPVLFGLLVKHKFPAVAKVLVKVCTILGSISVLAFAIIVLVTDDSNEGMLDNVPWTIVVGALLMAVLSGVFSYLCARIPCLTFETSARRTMAIETMMQNTALAVTITVVSYSLENKELNQIISFIFVYAAIQIGGAIIVVVSYLILKWRGYCQCLQIDEEEDITEDMETKLTGVTNEAFDVDDKDVLRTIL